jgi:hypothetical protein
MKKKGKKRGVETNPSAPAPQRKKRREKERKGSNGSEI